MSYDTMIQTTKSPINATISLYNAVRKSFRPGPHSVSSWAQLQLIEKRALAGPTDISDYLVTIFSEAYAVKPRLIVELGVRTGESRYVLEQVASLTGSALVSVDLDDCSGACGKSPFWHFVKADDVQFAKTFPEWCVRHQIASWIDVLFIDSSHLYEHTVEELKSWMPLLSSTCKVLLHDTNLRAFYRRLDGTVGRGWDNKRGVIRALEESLHTRFNERVDFVTIVDNWLIRHWAHCNGFTMMERVAK